MVVQGERKRSRQRSAFISCRVLRLGEGLCILFLVQWKIPADLNRRMTRSDLHVKKITLAAGWRMKGRARLDVTEQ